MVIDDEFIIDEEKLVIFVLYGYRFLWWNWFFKDRYMICLVYKSLWIWNLKLKWMVMSFFGWVFDVIKVI